MFETKEIQKGSMYRFLTQVNCSFSVEVMKDIAYIDLFLVYANFET